MLRKDYNVCFELSESKAHGTDVHLAYSGFCGRIFGKKQIKK
jgi:hypothetical protein